MGSSLSILRFRFLYEQDHSLKQSKWHSRVSLGGDATPLHHVASPPPALVNVCCAIDPCSINFGAS